MSEIKPNWFSWNTSHQAPLSEIAQIVLKTGNPIIFRYEEDFFDQITIIVGAKDIKEASEIFSTADFNIDHNVSSEALLPKLKIWEDYEY